MLAGPPLVVLRGPLLTDLFKVGGMVLQVSSVYVFITVIVRGWHPEGRDSPTVGFFSLGRFCAVTAHGLS